MEGVNSFMVLYKRFEMICFKLVQSTEEQITNNLREGGINTRPSDSNGVWCPLLLPAIMLLYCWTDQASMLYKLIAFISLSLLIYSFLFVLFLSTSHVVITDPVYGGCLASSLIATLAMYAGLKQGLLFSLSITLLSTILFAWLLRYSLTEFHKTFTIGEAMIVCQSVILFVMMAFTKFFFSISDGDDEMDFVNNIVYTVLSTVGLIVAVLYHLKDSQRNLKVLSYILLSAVAFVLLILHTLLGDNCIEKILNYVFYHGNRSRIFTFWLILVLLAVCALMFRTKLAIKATTVTRKTFHILASLVFMSGILLDIHLMYLAAGVGLAILVFVEALRKSRIEPISSALQSAFVVYCDEKDCGSFAMTPIYLYTGLACPLLLVPGESYLDRLSGVLSVGVGDTAASWFGSNYGFHKWPESSRSFEGTLFNILSQIGTVYMLTLFGLLNEADSVPRTCFSALVCSLVEARTSQVDNLVLPLVMLLAYRAV
ncbi:dolichol kinase [Danaus plexippus]|uniref:dolichol kinase n=1 Tax=Danaus plexippus TaxID=13037 RepID=UPI002AB04EEA|nr:dolichol kinase [Danaus plexippus]